MTQKAISGVFRIHKSLRAVGRALSVSAMGCASIIQHCPNFCTAPEGPYEGNMTGGQAMGRCPDTATDKYYCKNGRVSEKDCSNPAILFTISGVSPSPITTVVPSTIIALDTATIFIMPTWISSSLSPRPTETPPKNLITSEIPRAGDSGLYASRHALAIGVGVGAPVGVALLVLLGFLLCRKRRKDMELTEVYNGPPPIRPERPVVGSVELFDHREIDRLRSKHSLIHHDSDNPPLPRPQPRGLGPTSEDLAGQAIRRENTWI
ncbi:uncharacterized protein BP5553_09543 [Venustampulla echinocandica]|uniref:Uncharacterized protein n=1 Tax=Venustampulla echinocandica TaxID=2656787 RepID=A0A370TBA7_9HELO|nr:uncharacterized protein BP5553_09543 [Venustampulla echinocandica]RDL31334.1 hypothetical protein BP5553_09543 [Venustampulla echinocandica]